MTVSRLMPSPGGLPPGHGSGVKPGTVGAGCAHCEHGKTPPPFKVTA